MSREYRHRPAMVWISRFLSLATFAACMAACASSSSGTPVVTHVALPTVAPSAGPQATDIPLPTKTLQPTVDLTSTAQSEEKETAAAQNSTATQAVTEISAALAAVGENASKGSVTYWDPQSIPVESSGFNTIQNHLLPDYIKAADFAFHSKVIWEVKQKIGWVNCLFLVRIAGDLDIDYYYAMHLGRISGAGHVWLELYDAGYIIAWSMPPFISDYIKVDNKAQNDVLLVVQGTQFTVYVNEKKVGVWWNGKQDRGRFGFATWQDTGASVCTFADNWIWKYK